MVRKTGKVVDSTAGKNIPDERTLVYILNICERAYKTDKTVGKGNENVTRINGALFRQKEQNPAVHKTLGGTVDHHVKQNKPDRERQVVLHVFSCNESRRKEMKVECDN